MIRSYSSLRRLDTFEERYDYLKLGSAVGRATFGFDRYINQRFYTSRQWKNARRDVIARDDGCDLGIPDRPIFSKILIHHMNPITAEDINDGVEAILDIEYLITVTHQTHNAIHFGDPTKLVMPFKERRAGDTKLWG